MHKKIMKLLFFKTNLFMQEDWLETLKNEGHTVDVIKYIFQDFLKDDNFAEQLQEIVKQKPYDAVISCNFFPVVSDVCNICNIPYISWIYDSPIPNFHRFNTPWNQIYHFDKLEVEKYQKEGYSFIHHLPLAVNTERLDSQLGSMQKMPTYIHDISFVGNLYNNRTINASGLTNSAYLEGLFEGYAAAQTQFFNQNILDQIFKHSSTIQVAKLAEIFPWKLLYKIIHEAATSQERNHILRKLSEHFAIDLYTTSKTEKMEQVTVHPPIDYYQKMPEIFRNSRINLNISYRAIKSGMSARILDIMGCGGFLMTTPQPEIFDYFIEDTDFVAFRSLEELLEKCDYYLSHDENRHQIAQNGYRKVKTFHTYQKRIPILLSSLD